MDNTSSSLKNILSDEQAQILQELTALVPRIKNKFFSLGSDIDRFTKLLSKFNFNEAKKNGNS